METVTFENYYDKRREIVEANTNPVGVVLHEKELALDKKLIGLKRELLSDCGGAVPYDVPVLADSRAYNSELYRFCSCLPKGADLHIHHMAILPARELVAFLSGRDDVFINLSTDSAPDLKCVSPGGEIPEGYVRLRDAIAEGRITVSELERRWTVLGADAQENIWEYFERLFDAHSALSKNIDLVREYYVYAFRYCCRINILHLEIHCILKGERENCVRMVNAIYDAYCTVKRECPDFSARLIGAGLKYPKFDVEHARDCFLNTVYVRDKVRDNTDPEHISDFVIGFDLVNEEDSSRPLKEYAPMLLKAKQEFPGFGFFLHCGESLDAESDNLVDAYLMGASRVGHGMNLYRYPDLLKRYADSEICLEVCVISNQTLEYTKDVRIHPATEYIKRGVAVSLCSDDPAYQEHETLTDDFFAAIIGWNLGMAEIKQLCINSIVYSGLDKDRKRALMQAFRRRWSEFLDHELA